MHQRISPSLNDNPRLPWAGADNTNQFFTRGGIFRSRETPSAAICQANIWSAGTSGPPVPPTTATPSTGCSINWVPIPRRNRTKSTSITPTPSFKPTSTGLPPSIAIIPGAETNFISVGTDQFLHRGRRPAAPTYTRTGSNEFAIKLLSPTVLPRNLLLHHQQYLILTPTTDGFGSPMFRSLA